MALFLSQVPNLRVIVGKRLDGRKPEYATFSNGRYATEDPAVTAILADLAADPGSGVSVSKGSFVCSVCYGTFKTEFALNGHMRKHEKEVVEAPVEAPADVPAEAPAGEVPFEPAAGEDDGAEGGVSEDCVGEDDPAGEGDE